MGHGRLLAVGLNPVVNFLELLAVLRDAGDDARDAGDDAELMVADTGQGIAAEHIPRLTERFYRVDRSRSRDTGGTGLGMAIVNHVIIRHQGELKIQSTVGVGSQFSLVFPKQRIV